MLTSAKVLFTLITIYSRLAKILKVLRQNGFHVLLMSNEKILGKKSPIYGQTH